jgi:hypothetical protein
LLRRSPWRYVDNMNSIKIIITALTLISLMTTTSEAVWPVYHEPEFKGKILDIETIQPIEGVVVLAVYNKRSMGAGAGQYSSILNIREALTDRDGNFNIPSYTTLLLLPFTWQDRTNFLIYKPGYASLEWPLKDFLTGKETTKRELSPWYDPILKGYKIILRGPGIVELPKLKTRDERLRSMPSHPDELEHLEKQRTLIQLINEERRNLGEQELDPYKLRDYLLNMGKGERAGDAN